MIFQTRETPDKIIVSLNVDRIPYDSEIQEASDGMKDACMQAASESRRLIIDLDSVNFMSSPLLGQMIILEKLAKKHSVDLRLINASSQCLELFTMLRVDRLFRYDDGDDGATTPAD